MSSKLVRFAYFGLPLGALALARAGFLPRVIVLGHTDMPGGRRVRRELSRHTLVIARPELSDPHVQRLITGSDAEALLSWFFPRQIPLPILRAFPRGAFGAHPSLLPRWRGPDPYFWALHDGDRETGVSLHRLEAEYDTGNVIAQRTLAIDARDTGWRLAKRLDRPGLSLLLECARRLSEGERLEGDAQDPAQVTLAPSPTEEQLEIVWEQPVAAIVRLVRAASPFPGASCELGEELVDVLEVCPYPRPLPRALEPYDAVWTPAGLVVCAGDGAVVVQRVRREDGSILRGTALRALFPEGLTSVHFEPKSNE